MLNTKVNEEATGPVCGQLFYGRERLVKVYIMVGRHSRYCYSQAVNKVL